jgi:DNA processing protein
MIGRHERVVNMTTPIDPPSLFSKPESTPIPFGTMICGLSTVTGLGRKGIAALVDLTDSVPSRVWRMEHDELTGALVNAKTPNAERIANAVLDQRDSIIERGSEEMESLMRRNIRVVAHRDLPLPLRDIPSPPSWLFVEGDMAALFAIGTVPVAVVGTRKPSQKGLEAARRVAAVLGAYTVTVISGLADGIDAEAHRATMDEGLKNVAFLGHGINHVFPQATADVRGRILAEGGAVASEYLPKERYDKSYFVQRNRLQVAMANLVIPIEAQVKSGTAHTVRFALEYGKPLVGLRWSGSNGIATELARAGKPVIDIFESESCRMLDRMLKQHARQSKTDADPAKRMLQKFFDDLDLRDLPPSEVNALAIMFSSRIAERMKTR